MKGTFKRYKSIHAKTGIIAAPHNLIPIAKQAFMRPQCPVHPEHGTKQPQQLETLGRVDMLEYSMHHGKIVLDQLLVYNIHVT